MCLNCKAKSFLVIDKFLSQINSNSMVTIHQKIKGTESLKEATD